jgi:predicted CXXCH cytochrome family protein
MLLAVLALFVATGSTAYGLNLENHDDFCASCHTQPETQYYQQSLDQNPATLAAFHASKTVRCIDCHSGSGPFGRMEGLTQGTQDLLSYYSGHYNKPAITTNKLSDDTCLNCHDEMLGRTDFNNHFHTFLSRWQSVDPNASGCVDCHSGHPTANGTQQYLLISEAQQVCQDCHRVMRE